MTGQPSCDAPEKGPERARGRTRAAAPSPAAPRDREPGTGGTPAGARAETQSAAEPAARTDGRTPDSPPEPAPDPGREPGREPGRASVTRWRRPDASMSLLADLFAEEGLDPGYAAAARRRAARRRVTVGDAAGDGAGDTAGDTADGAPVDAEAEVAARRGPGRGAGRHARTFTVVLVAGLLAAVAFVQAKRAEPAEARQRERLIAEIAARTARVQAQQREVDRLRRQFTRSRQRAEDRGLARAQAVRAANRGAAAAAATPIVGAGLVITVDDAPVADDAAGGPGGGGRLYDRDLQELVNGLWAAGAQAIAVNGRRLAATSAIRSAGEAILVDFRAVSPPYVVSAIAEPTTVREAFDRTAAARHFRTLHSSFGVRFDVRVEPDLRLPAAPVPRLRHARKRS